MRFAGFEPLPESCSQIPRERTAYSRYALGTRLNPNLNHVMKISAARRHRQTINSPSYRLFASCCRLITADASRQRNNSLSSAAIALRARELSGGVETPHLTQFSRNRD